MCVTVLMVDAVFSIERFVVVSGVGAYKHLWGEQSEHDM